MQRSRHPNGSSHPLLVSLLLVLSLLLNLKPAFAQGDGTGEAVNAALAAPAHILPADNDTTTALTNPPVGVPTFTWSPVPGATLYNVQISKDAGFSADKNVMMVNQETVATTFTPLTVLADGRYFWRVRAQVGKEWSAFSAPWSFHKQWGAAGAVKPLLIAPAHDPQGQQVITTFSAQHFSWEPVLGAAAYTLEISVSPSFNDAQIYRATTLKTHHTPVTQLANNHYYWHVIPLDSDNNPGDPSEVREFTFGWNQIPTLLTPEDNLFARFMPRFTWTAVPGASSYILEISSQENPSEPVLSVSTKNTSYTPEKTLANDKEYFWQVRAVSPRNVNGPASAPRTFHSNWIQPPTLLSPPDLNLYHIYPYFSWTPVPGAEQYQIQISKSQSFATTLADVKLFGATAYTQPEWKEFQYTQDIFWRVRALDAQGNSTEWSDARSFQFLQNPPPNQIYPEPYYAPDAEAMPVHTDRTIAYPLFVWDTTHEWTTVNSEPVLSKPDYYRLEVAEAGDTSFTNVLFSVETAGQAATPTQENPFSSLEDGKRYLWRVTPMRGGASMTTGQGTVWETRIDRTLPQLPQDSDSQPDLLHPAAGFVAVGAAPVLGWLPVANATHYEVQISQNRTFPDSDDPATSERTAALYPYYAPWQQRKEPIPSGAYWWRVRAIGAGNSPLGSWSDARRFMLMQPLMTGNPTDYPVPLLSSNLSLLADTSTYDPALSRVATNTAPAPAPYSLGALHIVQDRSLRRDEVPAIYNFNWVIAFGVSPDIVGKATYALYFDMNQQEGVGASTIPRGYNVTTDALYRPEYAIYVDRTGNAIDNNTAWFYKWTGSTWEGPHSLVELGGTVFYDAATHAIEVIFPYSSIVLEETNQFGGAMALAVYSFTQGNTQPQDILPHQPGSALEKPVLVSDMPTPLYPFDTPLSNPTIFHELPSLRWRMPYANFSDGYEVQIARHPDFTKETVIESWESYESNTAYLFGPIPTAFRSGRAYNDNESYYWRVRYRHEKYDNRNYDYGPWSQPVRFKLSSYQPGNPALTLGNPATGEPAYATPSFVWDRVEGAAQYNIQIDNDFNMNSPLTDKVVDGNSFTALDTLADGTYYWRVAMRRSDNVLGQWTSIISFTKSSLVPLQISPTNDVVINQQPTFVWAATITNSGELRIAAPRYRLQWDDNPQFATPTTIETEATSYTPLKGQSLNDGTWYWRVAVIDGSGKRGPDSPTATFYKAYLRPEPLSPVQGSSQGNTITFEWTPLAGAAAYNLEIDDDDAFDRAKRINTENTRYTHTENLEPGVYYWRVQMVDEDNKPGPTIAGQFSQGPVNPGGPALYMPLVLGQ